MNNIKVYLNTLRLKGSLAYEYNPLYNFQIDEDLYVYKNKYFIPKDCAVNLANGEILTLKINDKWVDKNGIVIENVVEGKEDLEKGVTLYAKAGSLLDLDTDKLNFDLEHPVDITILPSYDGSVNLILNDDKNIPRLINSRFSVREKNTYEIVDRIGENDTNIYNSKTFDKDTSLYFLYESNPTVEYKGFINGILPVGQYCFYLTYCDADDNESDIIAETGLIPVFIGNDLSPSSMNGGIKNLDSHKGIKIKLINIDKSYNYFKICYVRYFADYQQNRVYECKKILQKYPINSTTVYVQITGNESTEDLDANILNISRFNPKSILAQAQCKNMLFFGNIVKETDNYKELLDCALRIIPKIKKETLNGLDYNYKYNSGFGYYNSSSIYNNTGYFNKEYYRFGVIFIYLNGTISNVYNTLGMTLTDKDCSYKSNTLFNNINNDSTIISRKYITIDDNNWIKNPTEFFENYGEYINSKGVCKLDYSSINEDDNTIYGIEFSIPEEVIEHLLKNLNIRGYFFVRQKCIPTILAQCYLLPMDELLEGPVLKYKNQDKTVYQTECFVSLYDKTITNDYESRLYKYKHGEGDADTLLDKNAYAAICPDFLLNLPYYNQIFNGSNFYIKQITENDNLVQNLYNSRFYFEPSKKSYFEGNESEVIINTVTEDVPQIAIEDKVFKLKMGEMEEVFRFKFAEIDTGTYDLGENTNIDAVNDATNIVRGMYSPYLAIYSNSDLLTGQLYNIYSSNFRDIQQNYINRMNSAEPFYAISDRYNFGVLPDNKIICWRGDCYINNFTYRLNRNFNDPSLPNNDVIIDKNTWKDNYDVNDSGKWNDISRSDLNAIQMGSWITLKVRSAMNYALRSIDESYVSEKALMGSPRSFYPVSLLLYKGANKLPDSYLYNDAYRATLGFKCYFALDNINYIKNTFSNRILYSAIAIQDSYKNNYRESLSTYYRDYSTEYGSIQKLVGFEGYLLVVLEHAIGIAVVNERILAGGGDGEPVFINTQNVLPEELTIITDTYGTQWPESVIKSEAGYVYGVDTIAKKIWRVKGQLIEILSDFKVNKFLVDNISLGEREKYPIIGLKNVKTHYNNNKKDIMFTFYDDIYKDEEKVWNLCYNELVGQFITFYSWIPSYSENIDTQYFSFDRNTSKYLTLLSKNNYNIDSNSGILLNTPLLDDDMSAELYYRDPGISTATIVDSDGTTILTPNEPPKFIPNVKFKLLKDHYGYWQYFEINQDGYIEIKVGEEIKKYPKYILIKKSREVTPIVNLIKERKVLLLCILPYYEGDIDPYGLTTNVNFKPETIAVSLPKIVGIGESSDSTLTTDFYLHGRAGLFNIKENFRPTYWYGEQHPFEFEFVVNDKIAQNKLFSNLVLIANKAEPESFHFEIEGDNYDFSLDKRNMYFRQEATKNLYLNLGSDIIFDRYYKDVAADIYTQERYARKVHKDYPDLSEGNGLERQVKSSIFPLYYEKIDTYNDIYHKYHIMTGEKDFGDFGYLSGSEIKWNRDENQFNVVTHIKNKPINLFGRLRGNSFYKEGTWNIQIPSITYSLKNESKNDWIDLSKSRQNENDEKTIEEKYKDLLDIKYNKPIPPIVINSQYVPKDLDKDSLGIKDLPNIYTGRMDYPEESVNLEEYVLVNPGSWTARKEAKIRDKWIKIRVRYSGKNLAIIHSLITLYNV